MLGLPDKPNSQTGRRSNIMFLLQVPAAYCFFLPAIPNSTLPQTNQVRAQDSALRPSPGMRLLHKSGHHALFRGRFLCWSCHIEAHTHTHQNQCDTTINVNCRVISCSDVQCYFVTIIRAMTTIETMEKSSSSWSLSSPSSSPSSSSGSSSSSAPSSPTTPTTTAAATTTMTIEEKGKTTQR